MYYSKKGYLENKVATFGMALEHHSAISNSSTLNKLKSMEAPEILKLYSLFFLPPFSYLFLIQVLITADM